MDLTWFINALQRVDWATLSNIAVVVSVLFIIRQLRETRYTTHAQAYSAAVEILQNEKVRQSFGAESAGSLRNPLGSEEIS